MGIFSLKQKVSGASNVDLDDIIPVKSTLNKFGAYDIPDYGLTQYPDARMIDGIKMYQKKNNLNIDGVMNPDGETVKSINDELTNNGAAHIKFDGKNATWMEDGKPKQSWPAMSGKSDSQCKEFEGAPNKGPIPEGKWIMRQDKHQNFWKDQNALDIAKSTISTATSPFGKEIGKWSGGIPAWGQDRVWLEPAQGTDTKGRNNLSVHGGWFKGSAGCIDLTDKMPEVVDKFKKHGKDVIIDVKYPKDCW